MSLRTVDGGGILVRARSGLERGHESAMMHDASAGLDADAFVRRYGGVYEHSPWVARRALAAGALPRFLFEPGRDPAGELRDAAEARGLADALAAALGRASDAERLELIRAHPDLVGRAALEGTLTDDSTREQSSAGLDRCTPDELRRFRGANDAYRARFGFPFVMAVRGADRTTILEAFERRLGNDEPTERRTALAEIDRIALLRLEAMVGAGASDDAGAPA